MPGPRFPQRRLLLVLLVGVLFVALLLLGIGSFPNNPHRIDLELVSLSQSTYGNADVKTRLFHVKDNARDLFTSYELTLEQQCVKEVLQRLGLPFRLDHYVLTQPPPRDLKLTELSAACRRYLTPKPVSAWRRKQLSCFLPKPWFASFGPNDQPRIDGAIRLVASAFRTANVPIYLDAGSALGSWRMHGIIPYDSDMDMMTLTRHEGRTRTVCRSLMNAFPELIKFYEHGYRFWRLDILRPNRSRLFQIDLFLNDLNEEKQELKMMQQPHKVNVSRLLPFVMRPFQGVLFLAWRNMPEYTRQMYGSEVAQVCAPATWIPYFYKIRCPTRRVKCEELNYFFNFVRRWSHPDGRLVEVLFNRTHVLSVFHAPQG